MTVEPDGTQDVTITLPANQPCSTAGAPCSKTLDGKGRKPLSNSPTAMVAGPVLVSVADAEGAEGSNGAVVFIVSLSRAPTRAMLERYNITVDDEELKISALTHAQTLMERPIGTLMTAPSRQEG